MNVADCVTANKLLPHEDCAGLWDSIVAGAAVKDGLLHGALLALELRPKLSFETTALHGLLLVHGPPGTGKTTLALGLAQEIAKVVEGRKARLIEVNPHGLMSAEHGQSQQKVMELLVEHIPLLADDGVPTIVVLDEVESMAVARSETSLAANPADVHRATDAVLSALDTNSRHHPHIVTAATSNFTGALDEAFKSRADVSIEMPLPDRGAIHVILQKTLREFAAVYPVLAALADNQRLLAVAARLEGLDGRRARKAVTEALAGRVETVLDPNKLAIEDLLRAAGSLAGTTDAEVRHAAA